VDVRRSAVGHWAFSLNRVTGLGLVFYLYLHLAVLSMLLRGEAAWHGFLRLATTPVFLGLDVLLIFGLLFHGLNGLRVIGLTMGHGTAHSGLWFGLVLVISAALAGLAGWAILLA
jgi:succinate dehydrogenase / fumarate reductase cytochrome b subunit